MSVDAGDQRRHAVVVGGGFAGAAAASALAEAGVAVTLLESRPILGGRATSYRDGITRQEVDNGQHLFIGAYRDTRSFLRRLKVDQRLVFDKRAPLVFYTPDGLRHSLSSSIPGPLGPLSGLLTFDALSIKDKFFMVYGLSRLRMLRRRDLSTWTVSQWLKDLKQTPGAKRAFWEPLCYATLNERPDRAAADAFRSVLLQGFLGSSEDRALGHATLPLGRLWSVELPAYLKKQGGHVSTGLNATGFATEGDRVSAVLVEGQSAVHADVVVSALPLSSFRKIAADLRGEILNKVPVDPSPIVAVNLWFKTPPFTEKMVGFLDLDIQWGFNRGRLWGTGAEGQISLVISAARAHTGRTSEALIGLALADLARAFPDFREEPIHATVTWEKEATPAPTVAFWNARPPVATSYENFFLAGDWVDVGLPPTIETACRSGHAAAAQALKYLEVEKCLKPSYSTAMG